MIILTIIGVVIASLDSFALSSNNSILAVRELMSPFDIELFGYDGEGENPEPDADKEPSRKKQDVPAPGHDEIHQEVIEV